MAYSLRPYQQAAVDDVWSYLCNRPGHPVCVMPTGAGKSLVIAELARGAINVGRRVLCLAHRKELLRQNWEKMQALMPDVEIGTYSAGLRKRDVDDSVICAGIQSVYNKAFEFGERSLVLVDEAHLIPAKDTGMYRQFIHDLSISNPDFRMVGLTATAYRLDSGRIYGDEQPFTDVCHTVPIQGLIDDGYLCPVESAGVTEVDTSGLHRRNGEFIRSEMETLFESHVIEACEETVAIANRESARHCLIFATGVEHAKHIGEIIERMTGDPIRVITGDTVPIIRETSLDQFKSGAVRWLINCDVLTTGFDSPNIDLVAVMRATESPGLFAQMAGRGFRLHPDKSKCLLLDFGGNLQRHGPLDSADYGNIRKGRGGDGEAPTKECPSCGVPQPAGLRTCECGWIFPPPEINHGPQADGESAVLESQQQEPEHWEVRKITYSLHSKPTGTDSMRVEYEVVPKGTEDAEGNLAAKPISEWICIEHEGFARQKAYAWWRQRSMCEFPDDVYGALEICRSGGVADCYAITTTKEGRFYRITDYDLGDVPDGVEFSYDDEEEAPF